MKLKVITPLLCSGVLAFSGFACSKLEKDKTLNTVVDTQSILESEDSSVQMSENLALAGEQLMSPVSFMYADMILDMALEKDSNNKRAQFYKTILKPIMQLKGVFKRVQPVVKTLNVEKQSQFNTDVANLPESAMKTFLLDGQENISNEEGLLKFLDEQTKAWEDVRQFMKANKDLNLDINIMTLNGVEGALEQAAKECQAQQISSGKFGADLDCNYLRALKVNVSRADVEMLQQIAAGFQIYLTAYTSYSLDGIRDFVEKNENVQLTSKDVTSHIANNTTAGKLRHNGLTKITEMGTDFISGARWALTLQDKLCPKTSNGVSVRPGSLFNEGLCIEETHDDGKSTEDTLKTLEKVLAGSLITMTYMNEFTGLEETADTRPAALIENPIADLRQIVSPIEKNFNECGDLVSVTDTTIGGFLPNGDANEIIMKSNAVEKNDCK